MASSRYSTGKKASRLSHPSVCPPAIPTHVGACVTVRPMFGRIFPKESLGEALCYLNLQFLLNLNLSECLQDITGLYVIVVDK